MDHLLPAHTIVRKGDDDMCRSSYKKSLIVVSVFLWFSLSFSNVATAHKAAIIIDDFGGDVGGVEQFLNATFPVTAAIMPFQDYSIAQDKQAFDAGLEVIIHMPMEPKKGKRSWLGPKAITTDLSNSEIMHLLEEALERVPHARGLNNHMGSKAMEDERIVRCVVNFAKDHHLYLIDSGTTARSVLPTVATKEGVPFLVRNIFLDDTLANRHHVYQKMQQFIQIAQKEHTAIAIGHVGVKGEETYAGITQALPNLKKQGIELVYPSEWLTPKFDTDLYRITKKGARP